MKVKRFEDLQTWQVARVLVNLVYDASDKGPFSQDFRLRDQIRGAAGSVMHNLSNGLTD
jgi:four helix bundle protein